MRTSTKASIVDGRLFHGSIEQLAIPQTQKLTAFVLKTCVYLKPPIFSDNTPEDHDARSPPSPGPGLQQNSVVQPS